MPNDSMSKTFEPWALKFGFDLNFVPKERLRRILSFDIFFLTGCLRNVIK